MNNVLKSHDIVIAIIDINDGGLDNRFDTIHWHGYDKSDEEVKSQVTNHIELLDKYNGAHYEIINIIR